MTGTIPGCEDLVEVSSDGDEVVLRAWQPAFRRRVGVRLYPGRRLEDLEAQARRTAPLADHPNVVTVHDLGATALGVPYVVTELLDQGSLADEVASRGPLDWADAVAVAIKVAGVLAAAAKAGVTGLAVTPADVFRSRFGEPKVALFGPPRGREASSVGARSFLRELLDGGVPVPSSVRAALADDGGDALSFARQLQQAERDEGGPVTELTTATTRAAPSASPRPEDFSKLVTVAPRVEVDPPRRRSPRIVVGATVLAVVAVAAAALTLDDSGRTPATTTTVPPEAPPVSRAAQPKILYDSAGFTGTEWPSRDSASLRTGTVDGEYRVWARANWLADLFRPTGHRRVSISVTARITSTGDGELGVYCGASQPGDKFLTGTVRTDGSWEIIANDRILSTGSVPERAVLREEFVLRFDCTTDTTPSRAVLALNDVVLGTGEGTGSFPLNGVRPNAASRGPEPVELSLRAVTIRALD